jgi:predicted alpha/beta hydrolase family esterase
VTVPGYGGSGADHWQTHWERDLSATRFRPGSWDGPDAEDWAGALTRAVRDGEGAATLVAHSLGCLTAASWLAEHGPGEVVGALLVAVPDPSGPAFPASATAGGFRVVRRRLPVPVTVIVSDDDPYASADWTRGLAAAWGAEVVGIGAAGHVNGASGLGAWSAGREILRRVVSAERGAWAR